MKSGEEMPLSGKRQKEEGLVAPYGATGGFLATQLVTNPTQPRPWTQIALSYLGGSSSCPWLPKNFPVPTCHSADKGGWRRVRGKVHHYITAIASAPYR